MKKTDFSNVLFHDLSVYAALPAAAFAADISVKFEHTEHAMKEYIVKWKNSDFEGNPLDESCNR